MRLDLTKAMVDDMDESIRGRVEVSDIERQGALDGLGVVLALETSGKLSLSTAILVVGSDYADSLHTWCSDPRWMNMRFMINLRDGENENHVRASMMAKGWSAKQLRFFTAGGLSSSNIKRAVFEATTLTESVEQLQAKAAALSRIPRIIHERHRTEPDVSEVEVFSRTKELEAREAVVRDELNAMMPVHVLEHLAENDKQHMNVLARGFKEKKPQDAENFQASIGGFDDASPKHARMKTTACLLESSDPVPGTASPVTLPNMLTTRAETVKGEKTYPESC
eukprot:TRINITY_DN4723_c0_g1_i1.p1 TRINITY_DN4723_c0_g1~~TRINITY_DN4723_c0_g1_i1.p1  ORF type:complete len:281 (+),score=54.64 TRINITY_DN4723_c0_g1_i1:220-1062(+)